MQEKHPPTESRLIRFLRPSKAKVGAALVIGALVGLGYWWFDGGRYLFSPKRFGVVEEGVIYRSGQIHPRLIEDVLRDHEIRVVVDLAVDKGAPADTAEHDAIEKLGIRNVDLATLDGSGIGDVRDYAVAVSEMVRAKREKTPILVHCAAGTQRTGAAVAIYRVLFQGWSGEQAHAEYLSYRGRPDQSGKLFNFVNENMERILDMLVEMGALEKRPEVVPTIAPAK